MTRNEALAYLELLRSDPRVENAHCLIDWLARQDRDDVHAALTHYLIHFALPALRSGTPAAGRIPARVAEALFLDAAPPGLPDTRAFLAQFPGALVVGLPDDRLMPGRQVEETEPWNDGMALEALKLRYGVFFTPNGLGTRRNEKGNLRHDQNVSRWNAVFVDYDQGKGPEVLAMLASRAEPSAVVETKKGYHAYWLLAENALAEDAWRPLERAAIAAHGGDPAASNPSRLMRLPGTWHCKAEPFPVRLASWNGRRHDPEALGRAFGVSPAAEAAKARRRRSVWQELAAQGGGKRSEIRAPRVQVLAEGYRHATAKEEIARMFANLDESRAPEARDAAVLWYENSCSPLKRHWEREIHDIVDWVEAREYGRVVSR